MKRKNDYKLLILFITVQVNKYKEILRNEKEFNITYFSDTLREKLIIMIL
jgi:hypothetical protein